MIELPVSSLSHLGIVSAVDTINVEAFDLLDLVHCYIAGKRYLGILSEGVFLASSMESDFSQHYITLSKSMYATWNNI